MAEDNGEERRTRVAQAWLFGIGGGAVLLALLLSAYVIGYNQGEGDAEPASPAAAEPAGKPEPETADTGPGKDLFASNCGSCHTLAAAGTSGATGPDLDTLAPDEAQVLAAIENGGTGSGAMPAGLVSGADADAVAAYVAENAGG